MSAATATRLAPGARGTLPPALAGARARGLRELRSASAPPRPADTPVPTPPTAAELSARLTISKAQRGKRGAVDLRRQASAQAMLTAFYRQARSPRRGRRPSGTIRTSWGHMVRALAPTKPAWRALSGDLAEDGRTYRRPVRAVLEDLALAGCLSWAPYYDAEGQARGLEIVLLELEEPPPEDLDDMGRRHAHWRRRYGNGSRFAAHERSGAILARVEGRRRADRRRWPAPRRPGTPSSSSQNGLSHPRFAGASGFGSSAANASSLGEASCGASAYARQTRPHVSTSPNGPAALASPTDPKGNEERGGDPFAGVEERVAQRRALAAATLPRWRERLVEAERACRSHPASAEDPLPSIAVLRLALAGRRLGVEQLAAGASVAGFGPQLVVRLRRAASRWVRHGVVGEDDLPVMELLRRASARPDDDLGELVRAFATAARARSRAAKAARGERLAAMRRRAERDREAILARWPAWLDRDGDELVTAGAYGRFVQVRRLPPETMLGDPGLRRWLRDITALLWGTPAAAIELTDPDGAYAFVPLDGARLAARGERARSPWTSREPARPRRGSRRGTRREAGR